MTSFAEWLPPNAVANLPLLKQQQLEYWPTMPFPASQAGQVERETCAGLKSKNCWSVNAQLRTEREYGFGFGQTTVAYNKDGTERFNAWKDIKAANPTDLKEWTWEKRLDPTLNMRALVLYDYSIYRIVSKSSANETARLSFMYAAYNGGTAGLLKEIKLCSVTPNCDPTNWKSENGKLGVEATSVKSTVKWQGYGQSAKDINRSYVQYVMDINPKKYEEYFPKR